MSSRPNCLMLQVPGQPRLHSEIFFSKNKKTKRTKNKQKFILAYLISQNIFQQLCHLNTKHAFLYTWASEGDIPRVIYVLLQVLAEDPKASSFLYRVAEHNNFPLK